MAEETALLDPVDTAAEPSAPPEETETVEADATATEPESKWAGKSDEEIEAEIAARLRDQKAGLEGQLKQEAQEKADEQAFDEAQRVASFARNQGILNGTQTSPGLIPLVRSVEREILRSARSYVEKNEDIPEIGMPDNWLRETLANVWKPYEFALLASHRETVRQHREAKLKADGIKLSPELVRAETLAITNGDPVKLLDAEWAIAVEAAMPEAERRVREALKKEEQADTTEKETAKRQKAGPTNVSGGAPPKEKDWRSYPAASEEYRKGFLKENGWDPFR